MKSTSQSPSHRKPVGGLRSVKLCASDNIERVTFASDQDSLLEFVDSSAVMECSLLEDSSSFEEEFSFDQGVVAVKHQLTLVANRDLGAAWLEPEFSNEDRRQGLCAVVTLNDGRQLLVGYSKRFGAQQPLRIKEVKVRSGRKLSDVPTVTLILESCDTSAASTCQII